MFRSYRLLGNWVVVISLLLLVGLPVYGPPLSYLESQYFPAASKITIVSVSKDVTGLNVVFTYTKKRLCEFLGGYAKRGISEVGHEATGGDNPTTVDVGVTITRAWHIDALDMDNLEIWFAYRCEPFWVSIVKVYP